MDRHLGSFQSFPTTDEDLLDILIQEAGAVGRTLEFSTVANSESGCFEGTTREGYLPRRRQDPKSSLYTYQPKVVKVYESVTSPLLQDHL